MVSAKRLEDAGLTEAQSQLIAFQANQILSFEKGLRAWEQLKSEVLCGSYPFEVHAHLFEEAYRGWDSQRLGPPPAWVPTPEETAKTNISSVMRDRGFRSYGEFFLWSVSKREAFWKLVIERLEIKLRKPAAQMLDLSEGVTKPKWLAGAELNIVESCFSAPSEKTAILFQKEGGRIQAMTYGELDGLSDRVAIGLGRVGLSPGDRVAIDMTMAPEAVAIYLGIIKAGCAAVSIADSFAPEEIATRLRISEAKAIFTQDKIFRGGKSLPLYSKVIESRAPRAVVLELSGASELRAGDVTWEEFLPDEGHFSAVACEPETVSNVLFSSGTTGDPKAIPWTHLTPLKCAMDAHFHHDVHSDDILCWPTNLGWMMGPWLIYATFVNRATMALFDGVPSGREFGTFVQDSAVTILGLVPSIVKAWRNSGCLKGLDWSRIKAFSSSGECSNAQDSLFLMSLAGYRPVVEYCGGTEIGGAYITQTLVQACSPSVFSTPTLGLDFVILDEDGKPAKNGELFLVPPSIGLSNRLLNRDHDQVYHDPDVPLGPNGATLRRHGDQVEALGCGYFRAHGRADDTMNLGGIKVSSAEIERVLNSVPNVVETAAVAMSPPGGGPSLLVVYAVLRQKAESDLALLRKQMQTELSGKLNPLFKVAEVKTVDALPRTSSNKVMRRVLRSQLEAAPI